MQCIYSSSYHHLFELNVTILRFFNVYGPAGRPDMMPMRLMHAVQDGTQIKLFNNGDIHRDWTYIDDTVDGVIAAVDKPLGYEIINGEADYSDGSSGENTRFNFMAKKSF